MKRISVSILIGLVVIGLMLGGGVVMGDTGVDENEQDEEMDTMPPGLQMAITVGSTQQDIDSVVQDIQYDRAVANSNAPEQDIGAQVEELVEKQSSIAEERRNLVEKRNDGELTQGEFQYRMAMLSHGERNVDTQVENMSDRADSAGVDVDMSAVDELRNNASEMSGQEVSEVARSIAGGGPPDHVEERRGGSDRGDSGASDNATESDEEVDEAEEDEEEESESTEEEE